MTGLSVTDVSGQSLDFARTTGRHFSKILSGLIFFVGYNDGRIYHKKAGVTLPGKWCVGSFEIEEGLDPGSSPGQSIY